MKFFLYIFIFFSVSFQIYAAPFCISTPENNVIEIKNIYVPPGAANGTILGQSGLVRKTITCSSSLTLVAIPAINKANQQTSSVSINKHGVLCKAFESNYEGIGFVWYNHNNGTDRWNCINTNATDANQRRGLSNNGDTIITDDVYLVKTGPIDPGVMHLNQTFLWSEARSLNNEILGDLFTTQIIGNVEIESPFCQAVKAANTSTFPTKDAVTKSYSNIIDYNIVCSGAIEDSSNVDLYLNPTYKLYSKDNSYFGTSLDSVGVRIEYATSENLNEFKEVLTSSNKLSLSFSPIGNTIKLKVTPYIKDNTGDYPLENNVKVDFDIKSEQQ